MLHHDGSSVYIQQNLRVGQRLRLAAKRELNLDSHCHNIVSSLCKQPRLQREQVFTTMQEKCININTD